jgi:hypothetical protein
MWQQCRYVELFVALDAKIRIPNLITHKDAFRGNIWALRRS